VQQVQGEYQEFMEQIRSKAQHAIDAANREYQASKTKLNQHMGIMIDYLQVPGGAAWACV
jgi:hypothetical protein